MRVLEVLVLLAIIALALYVFVRSPKRPRGKPSGTQSPFFRGGDGDGS